MLFAGHPLRVTRVTGGQPFSDLLPLRLFPRTVCRPAGLSTDRSFPLQKSKTDLWPSPVRECPTFPPSAGRSFDLPDLSRLRSYLHSRFAELLNINSEHNDRMEAAPRVSGID